MSLATTTDLLAEILIKLGGSMSVQQIYQSTTNDLLKAILEAIDSGGAGGSIDYRANIQTISAGTRSPTFSSSVASANYILFLVAWTNYGGIGYEITNKTTGGFTITVEEDCTIQYLAIPIK